MQPKIIITCWTEFFWKVGYVGHANFYAYTSLTLFIHNSKYYIHWTDKQENLSSLWVDENLKTFEHIWKLQMDVWKNYSFDFIWWFVFFFLPLSEVLELVEFPATADMFVIACILCLICYRNWVDFKINVYQTTPSIVCMKYIFPLLSTRETFFYVCIHVCIHTYRIWK